MLRSQEERRVKMIDLEGMYDLHIHPAPSLQKRRFTALEAVKLASEEKMAGVLFLDHTYNTTTMALTINEMNFQTKAFGTIKERGGRGIELGGRNRLALGNKADPDADLQLQGTP
jgi:hypothetical protein